MRDLASSDQAGSRPVAGGGHAWQLTTREAALALGRSVSTVRRAIAAGRLPATRGPRGYRIAPDDLARFAERQATRTTPAGRAPSLGRLPWPRTELIGRDQAIAAGRALLLDQAVPLLTLVGPAGVGKTRLALVIGQQTEAAFAHGAVFVNLAPVTDPDRVLAAMALALGVHATGDRPLAEQVAAFLRPRQLLLILDNCEQVLAAAPVFADLLAACPAVQVLATSRAPLRLRGENLLPVSPLALPGPTFSPSDAELPDAMVLFSQRARAVDPAFNVTESNAQVIAGICIRLDGLPLALELAASRLRLLSPEALLALLSRRLTLLTGGARDLPARQRTLRDAIAWSYELLSPAVQRLFRRLAVFAGGFDLAAATAVAGGAESATLDELSALIDQSLVQRTESPDGSLRFTMLETIHEFAWERLNATGEEASARRAHATYYTAYAEYIETVIYGPRMSQWLDRFAEAWPNLEAALDYLGGTLDELRLAGLMSEFWAYRGHLPDGIAALSDALERNPDAPPRILARAHCELAFLCHMAGDNDRALVHSAAGLVPARAHGDPYRLAQILYVRALAVGHGVGRWTEAITHLEEARALADRLESPDHVLSFVLPELAFVWRHAGHDERAVPLLQEALTILLRIEKPLEAGEVVAELGRLDYEAGDRARAASRYGESLRLLLKGGSLPSFYPTLGYLAGVAVDAGQFAAASKLLGMIESIRARTGAVLTRQSLGELERIDGLARSALGPAAFAAVTEAERRRDVPEAIAEAIDIAESLRDPPAMPAPPAPVSASPAPRFGLTRREREVLTYLCQRHTDPEIAAQLFLSTRTVESHVARIFAKLDVTNRRDAVAVAAQHQLIDPKI
jgi:non-specific serine/threonine protein kinase